MATSAGPGAVGVNIRDLCPICGKDPQKNGCLVNRDVTVCPNSGKCGNKDAENDNRRRNCTGYLCGNIGMGTFLGSNILGSSYNAAGLEPRSPYHAGSIWDNYRKKVERSNADIVKNLKAGERKQQSRMFTGEMDELNTQQQSQDLYRYVPHPLYIKPKSIEAHHLICSEAMSSKRWRTFCKMTGYNINCYLNGVFLPADLPLACAARLPLHSGGHSLGFAGRSQNRRVSYVTQVKKEVQDILKKANDNKMCKSTDDLKRLVNQLNGLSEIIFYKVKNFEWTITWDGFDYQPGNPIGCANQVSIQDKKGTRRIRKEDGTSVKVEYSEEMKKMQSSLKTATGFREKIASIEDVERKQDMVGKFFEKIKKDKKILCTCSRKHDEIEKIDKPYTKLKLGE